MGDNDELTEKLRSLRDDTPLTGVPINRSDLISVGRGRTDKAFYEEAYQRTVIRGPCYWTVVKKYKYMSQIPKKKTLFGVSHETNLSLLQERINNGEFFSASPANQEGLPASVAVGASAGDESLGVDDGDGDMPCDFAGSEDGSLAMPGEEARDPLDMHPDNAINYLPDLAKDICEEIQTADQLKRAIEMMQRFREDLAEENAPAEATHNPQGMVSLPETETRRSVPRHRKIMDRKNKGEPKRRR